MGEFTLTQAARRDVLDICEYFDSEADGPALGDRFMACAMATFEKLAQTPGLGRARVFPNHAGENLKSWKVDRFPNYLVFYKPVADGVAIVRIIHGARDLGKQFDD